MRISFDPKFIQLILDGVKIVTRRYWKQKPPKVGDVVGAVPAVAYKDRSIFAKLQILSVSKCRKFNVLLPDSFRSYISEENYLTLATLESQKEGFESEQEFYSYWDKSYPNPPPDKTLWRIEFEVVRGG